MMVLGDIYRETYVTCYFILKLYSGTTKYRQTQPQPASVTSIAPMRMLVAMYPGGTQQVHVLYTYMVQCNPFWSKTTYTSMNDDYFVTN